MVTSCKSLVFDRDHNKEIDYQQEEFFIENQQIDNE